MACICLCVYIDIHVHGRRFIMGIGSHHHGGPHVPLSTACELETLQSWQHDLFQIQRCENRYPTLGAGEAGCLSWSRGRGLSLPLWFWSVRPFRVHSARPAGEGGPQATFSLPVRVLSPGNTLTDTPRSTAPALWASFGSASLANKFNHHESNISIFSYKIIYFLKVLCIPKLEIMMLYNIDAAFTVAIHSEP